MRRPRKLARPKDASKSVNSLKLAPGMETLELTFDPIQAGRKSATNGSSSRSGHGAKEARAPWIIRWETNVGASVDKGSRLARVMRGDAKGSGGSLEHIIQGED